MRSLLAFIMAIAWQVASFVASLGNQAVHTIERIFKPQATQPPMKRKIVAPAGIHDPATAKPSYVYRDSASGLTVTAKLGNDEINVNDKKAYLLISLAADEILTEPSYQRKPLNISLVVDRSGSMSGDKLNYVTQALEDMESYLSAEDLVSLVIYDDDVETLIEPQQFDRDKFIRAIEQIKSGGSTNLEGGLRQGLDHVARMADDQYINRVILLSDGLANVGVDSPHGLAQIVKQGSYESINVSTIGVGADYDERLMTTVANAGRGNYYFMEAPQQAADIFSQEFDSLTQVVAENIQVEFNFDHSIKLVQGIGYDFSGANSFNPYNLPAGTQRHYLFELDYLGSDSRMGAINLANLEINYTSQLDGARHTIYLPITVALAKHQLNPLADDQVYTEFMDSYIAEEMWKVYEDLDAQQNAMAKDKLDTVYSDVNQANVRLEGKLDSQVKEIESRQVFVEELKDEDVNAAPAGRIFQKSVQSESYSKVYNK